MLGSLVRGLALLLLIEVASGFVTGNHGALLSRRAYTSRVALTRLQAKGFGSKPAGSKKSGEEPTIWRGMRALCPDRLPSDVSAAKCPCGSGKSYGDCCLPLHEGTQLPETPEALLRSRYTAYFYGFPDYLVSTTHPKSNILGRMNAKKYLAQIEESCTQFELKGLQIVDQEHPSPDTAFITFVVKSRTLLSERSKFVKGERWLWIDQEQ